MTRPTDSRIAGLDALRGIAAVAVLVFHYTNPHADIPELRFPEWGDWFRVGQHGVELFFVISGYVMLMSIERAATPWRFIVARMERLMPTFWVGTTVTFLAVIALGLGPRIVSVTDWFVGLTMNTEAVNIALRKSPPWRTVDGVYWTLKVEWFFYFLILGVRLIKGIGREQLWCVLWITLGLLLQLVSVMEWLPVPWALQVCLGAKWAPYLATGVIIARMQQGAISRSSGSLILAGFGLAAGVMGGLASTGTWWGSGCNEGIESFVVWAIATAGVGFATSSHGKKLGLKPLLWLGAISYPLYLVHQNIGLGIILRLQRLGVGWWGAAAAATASCLVLAWILHELVEVRVAEWIKRRRAHARV